MKYELTNEQHEFNSNLFRIKALKDFCDVKKGDLGGFVESTKNLSQDGLCWIYGNAKVYENAEVSENARVYGAARVYEIARVYGDAEVSENAEVYGSTSLRNHDQIEHTSNYFNIIGFEYPITVTPISINIGCKSYTLDQLDSFVNDDEYDNKTDFTRIKLMIEIALDRILEQMR